MLRMVPLPKQAWGGLVFEHRRCAYRDPPQALLGEGDRPKDGGGAFARPSAPTAVAPAKAGASCKRSAPSAKGPSLRWGDALFLTGGLLGGRIRGAGLLAGGSKPTYPKARATSARNSGNVSSSNQGLRRIQPTTRQLGCGSGKIGRKSRARRTASVIGSRAGR